MKSVSPKLMALGLSLAVAVGGTTSLVYAHSGAKGMVKERMEMMKGMGDAMKTMGAMFKGEALSSSLPWLPRRRPFLPNMPR